MMTDLEKREQEDRVFWKYAIISGVISTITLSIYAYRSLSGLNKTLSDKITAGVFTVLGSGFVSSGVGAIVGTIAETIQKIENGTIIAKDISGHKFVPTSTVQDQCKQQMEKDSWARRQEEDKRQYEKQQADWLEQQRRDALRHSWKMHNDAQYYRMRDEARYRDTWYNK